jgi:hypothetical protein
MLRFLKIIFLKDPIFYEGKGRRKNVLKYLFEMESSK